MARKASLAERRRARKAYERARATSRPGEGKRFAAVERYAAASGAENPRAVAASVMWKNYGKEGGAALIRAGKRRAKRSKSKSK